MRAKLNKGGHSQPPSGLDSLSSSVPQALNVQEEQLHQSFENLGRFSEVIAKEDEYSMAILRTHLLIEEKLREYLATVFVSENCIRKANLTFNQVMRLAQGLKNDPDMKWFWDSILLLNKIRNDMAHNVNIDIDKTKCDELIGLIRKVGMSHLDDGNTSMLHPIKGPLAYLYSQTCCLVDESFGFLRHKHV